jgi:hypothetical protein
MRPHVKALRTQFDILNRNGAFCLDDKCAKCKRTKEELGVGGLSFHHIISIRSLEPDDPFNPNTQENLATLCLSCHYAYHKCYEVPFNDDFNRFMDEVPVNVAWKALKAYRREKKRFKPKPPNPERNE